MVNTLTVVACNPFGNRAGVYDDEGDGHIELFLTALKPDRLGPNHVVARASSVQGLIAALASYPHQPLELLQVIGHGRAGELSLGDGDWPAPRYKKGESYRLNSNFGTYAALVNKVPSSCRVLLLGCSVGDCVPLAGGVAHAPDDGLVLLFDLSHTLGCEVWAPVDAISGLDLDSSGLFPDTIVNGKSRFSKASAGTTTLGTAAPKQPPPPPPPLPPRPAITFTRMRRARGLGEIAEVDFALTSSDAAGLATRLADRISTRSSDEPALALPEFEFEAELEGQPWKAEVLGNGRFARLSREGEVPRTFPIAAGPSADGPGHDDGRATTEYLQGLAQLSGALDLSALAGQDSGSE